MKDQARKLVLLDSLRLRAASYDIRDMKELIDILQREATDKLTTAKMDVVQLYQGEIRAFKRILSELEPRQVEKSK